MESSVENELQAAVAALSNKNPEGAITALEALLVRTPPLEPMPEMFARGLLAPALASTGRIDEARVQAERAHGIAESLGDKESAEHYDGLLRQLGVVRLDDGAVDGAFDRAAGALDRGDFAGAESELQMVLVAALANRRADIEASARGMLAQALLLSGATDQARDHAEKALEISREIGDEGAAEHFEKLLAQLATPDGVDAFRREADITRRADAAAQDAGRAMEAGDFDLAVSLLLPISAEAEFAGLKESEATLRGMLAQSHLLAGRRKEAEREAKAAIAIAEQLGSKEAADGFRQILQLAIGFSMPISKA